MQVADHRLVTPLWLAVPERLLHHRHQGRRHARLPGGKQGDIVATANELVALGGHYSLGAPVPGGWH